MKRLIPAAIVALALAVGFAFLAHQQPNFLVVPGKSVGNLQIGMPAAKAIQVMGKPAFVKTNDDGSVLMEWNLIPNKPGEPVTSDIPQAEVWGVFDAQVVNGVQQIGPALALGSDSPKYHLADGVHPGMVLDDKAAKLLLKDLGKDPDVFFNIARWSKIGFELAVNDDGTIRSIVVFKPGLV